MASEQLHIYEILAKQHEPMLLAYILSLVADAQLAEDIAQETLLIAYRKIGTLKKPESFGAWLRGIARFEIFAALRTDCPAFTSRTMSACFRRKSSRGSVVPVGLPSVTPLRRASARPELMRSRSVSTSPRAISESKASMMPAAGFRFPLDKSVSMPCACQ